MAVIFKQIASIGPHMAGGVKNNANISQQMAVIFKNNANIGLQMAEELRIMQTFVYTVDGGNF